MNDRERIDQQAGTCISVVTAGGDNPHWTLFTTASAAESYAICELLRTLLANRNAEGRS